MTARDILRTDLESLVPRSAGKRRPLPQGHGVTEGEYTLEASFRVLLQHSVAPLDEELMAILKQHANKKE